MKPPPDSPNPASQAQKPRVNHLPISKGLNSVCLTCSIARLMGSVTLISAGGVVGKGAGFTVFNPDRAYVASL